MNPFELIPRPAPAPAAGGRGQRLYGAAEYNRLNADWAPAATSSDAEIVTSLRTLRNRSRQLIRDNEYALNGVRLIQNNVIGTGIGLEPLVKNNRGKLIESLNQDIHELFYHDWWKRRERVHTAGLMTGPDIERFAMRNVVESGEAFIRIVRQPFGDSKIPLAFELLESDRVMDQWTQAIAPNGNTIRMGIEVDKWHRPTAYWCWPQHPGDYQFSVFTPSAFIRVPAQDMIHLYVIDRWPQTRGVPWYHATMKRLNNMGGYEESEIVAARGSAAIMGFVTSPDLPSVDAVENGKRLDDMEPGQIRHLLPGETFSGFNPSRPNANMEPFMRFMLRGVASAIGCSYESLARDYSNTNYSSARASLLEDRDLWRVLQHWFIGGFRHRVHKEFMEASVMAGQLAIQDFFANSDKYLKAHFRPRGWSWIDPSKEVDAAVKSVRAGFQTVGDVIEQNNHGRDADDVFKTRREELDTMAELDLVFDTDPAQVNQKGIAQPSTAPQEEIDEPAKDGELASQPGDGGSADDSEEEEPPAKQPPARKVISLVR